MGVVIVSAMMIAAVWMGYRMRPTDVPCKALEYIVADRAQRMYLTPQELDQLLQEDKCYPVGRPLDRGVLHRIETSVSRHPMVRTAECYATPRHEVKVRITQRVPLLRVVKPGDTFFIDADRKVMQARAAVKDSVLIATGAVGVQIASNQLADFAEWLQDNSYWRKRIDHVHVQSPQMIYLYMRNGQPRVAIGSMHRYEKKLAKMRTFLENSAEAVQDKHYTEYDVRFKGQVIGRY